MSFPNSDTVSFGDLASTTINFFSSAIADNLTNQNALFSALNESGNVMPYDGGLEIQEVMDYAANGNVNSYSGADPLSIAQQETFTSALFSPANYAGSVIWTGEEMRANAGDAAKHNLLKARIKNVSRSMLNRLNQDLYLDGTGNGGKNLTGLAAAIPLANTAGIYGGINRNLWPFWQNQKFQATVDGTGVVTAASPGPILLYLDNLMLKCSRQNDKPDLIICDDATYSIINAALQTNQRFASSKSADAGFEEISYKGVRIRRDSAASGASAGQLYMINTKFLHLRPHRSAQFVDLPEKASLNQDAVVRTMIWAGNLTCSGQKFQGRFSNT
jgi:hypothetical protein